MLFMVHVCLCGWGESERGALTRNGMSYRPSFGCKYARDPPACFVPGALSCSSTVAGGSLVGWGAAPITLTAYQLTRTPSALILY